MYTVDFLDITDGERIKDHFHAIAKERGLLALQSWSDKNNKFIEAACLLLKELYGFDCIRENGSVTSVVFASEQDYLLHVLKWS